MTQSLYISVLAEAVHRHLCIVHPCTMFAWWKMFKRALMTNNITIIALLKRDDPQTHYGASIKWQCKRKTTPVTGWHQIYSASLMSVISMRDIRSLVKIDSWKKEPWHCPFKIPYYFLRERRGRIPWGDHTIGLPSIRDTIKGHGNEKFCSVFWSSSTD
jgi:hypothetical protein